MKLLLTILILSLNTFLLAKETMSVQVKNTVLRASPSFLGKKITNLKYGDSVNINAIKKDWANIFAPDIKKSGWLHISSLSDKQIILKQSDLKVQTSASSGEIVMAGKGFSKNVEENYKKNNKHLNYKLVDNLESQNVSTNEIIRFAKNGKLNLSN